MSQAATTANKGEISTSPVTNFDHRAWPDKVAPEGGALVGAPRWSAVRDSFVLVSVTNLARAGLDIARVASATLQVQGKTGDTVQLSTVARLVRESRSQPDAKEKDTKALPTTNRASSVSTKKKDPPAPQ